MEHTYICYVHNQGTFEHPVELDVFKSSNILQLNKENNQCTHDMILFVM